MLTHNQIWHAIDALAARNGLSPSGLAKIAGLDPTTFNKSKRGGANGKLRWPSTESVSKVLAATNASMEDFVSLIGRELAPTRAVAEKYGIEHVTTELSESLARKDVDAVVPWRARDGGQLCGSATGFLRCRT